MTINATFEGYEDMLDFAKKLTAGCQAQIPEKTVVKEEKPVKKTKPAAEPEKEPEVKTEEAPAVEESQYTLEDVRAALGALQKAGKKEQVKELLQSFGAAKLPEVDPADYPALMKKAGELDA